MWAIAATVAGVVILKRAPLGQTMLGHIPTTGVATALFVLGPLAFLAQVLRMTLVTVTVDPPNGLVLRNSRRISWEEIAGVDYAGLRFVSGQGVLHFLLDVLGSLTGRIPGFGLMSLLRIGLMGVIACLLLAVALLSGVLLPVMLLLSPWEPRVVVRTKAGRHLVWRDLIREVDFVHCIEAGLRRAGTQEAGPLAGVGAD
jgi:hypothetical protein